MNTRPIALVWDPAGAKNPFHSVSFFFFPQHSCPVGWNHLTPVAAANDLVIDTKSKQRKITEKTFVPSVFRAFLTSEKSSRGIKDRQPKSNPGKRCKSYTYILFFFLQNVPSPCHSAFGPELEGRL
jgi:hypothetical protein